MHEKKRRDRVMQRDLSQSVKWSKEKAVQILVFDYAEKVSRKDQRL